MGRWVGMQIEYSVATELKEMRQEWEGADWKTFTQTPFQGRLFSKNVYRRFATNGNWRRLPYFWEHIFSRGNSSMLMLRDHFWAVNLDGFPNQGAIGWVEKDKLAEVVNRWGGVKDEKQETGW